MGVHPVIALARRAASDPARPVLTHIDAAAGTRIELSAVTLANNVAKTAGLLGDELGVPPRGVVGLALAAHWNVAVWAMAAWSIGATVQWLADGRSQGCDVVACSVDRLAAIETTGERVAVSGDPFGGPCRVPLPPGVLDWSVAMRGHPDVLVPRDLQAEPEALLVARTRDLPPHARLLVASDAPERVVTGLLTTLAAGASLVVVTGGGDLDALATQERIEQVLSD